MNTDDEAKVGQNWNQHDQADVGVLRKNGKIQNSLREQFRTGNGQLGDQER